MKTRGMLVAVVLFCCAGGLRAQPRARALLIGIDHYPNVKPLNGCVNDITAMRVLLVNRYQFAEGSVEVLADSAATRQRILRAFHRLIDSTRQGDIVVIDYSGHGTQIADAAEIDGMDEAIIPYDYDPAPGGAYPIADKQIAGMLAELGAKTDNITIILDCCHSGGGTKDLAIDGKIERRISADTRKMPISDEFLGRGRVLKAADSKYILVAACLSRQSSYEKVVSPAIHQGELTYYLVQALQSASAPRTWRQVIEEIGPRISDDGFDQTPVLEGLNRNNFIFGGQFTVKKPYVTVRQSGGKVVVGGGQCFGLEVGSVFAVYPAGELEFAGEGVAKIRIVKVGLATADAEVIAGKLPGGVGRAVEVQHAYSAGELVVGFRGDWGGRVDMARAVLAIAGVSEDEERPELCLRNGMDAVTVFLGRDSEHPVAEFAPVGAGTGRLVDSTVKHWLYWMHVAKIRNPAPRVLFGVELKEAGKGLDFDHPDNRFRDGAVVEMTITNQSVFPIYMTVLDMEDNGNITAYTLRTDGGTVTLDPDKFSQEAIGPAESKVIEMLMQVRPGRDSNKDVLKVFGSRKPISFDFLEDKGSAAGGAGSKGVVPLQSLDVLDGWNAVEKLLLVSK